MLDTPYLILIDLVQINDSHCSAGWPGSESFIQVGVWTGSDLNHKPVTGATRVLPFIPRTAQLGHQKLSKPRGRTICFPNWPWCRLCRTPQSVTIWWEVTLTQSMQRVNTGGCWHLVYNKQIISDNTWVNFVYWLHTRWHCATDITSLGTASASAEAEASASASAAASAATAAAAAAAAGVE